MAAATHRPDAIQSGDSPDAIGRDIRNGGSTSLFRDNGGFKYRIPYVERCGRRGAMYSIHSERSAGEGLGGRFSHIGWLIEFNS